jgi:hypothetical protein
MEDSLIVVRLFEEARGQDVRGKSVGEIMVWVGKQFIGAPYVPHTLELPGEEQLVINLREFDCVTFVESVLALAQCIKGQSWTFDAADSVSGRNSQRLCQSLTLLQRVDC